MTCVIKCFLFKGFKEWHFVNELYSHGHIYGMKLNFVIGSNALCATRTVIWTSVVLSIT